MASSKPLVLRLESRESTESFGSNSDIDYGRNANLNRGFVDDGKNLVTMFIAFTCYALNLHLQS